MQLHMQTTLELFQGLDEAIASKKKYKTSSRVFEVQGILAEAVRNGSTGEDVLSALKRTRDVRSKSY